LTDLWHINVN